MGRRQSFLDISYAIVIGGIAILALLIIVSPVVIALMISFTEGRSLKFPPTGFSFTWYEQLFDPVKSRQIHRTAGNSLHIAAFSTLAHKAFAAVEEAEINPLLIKRDGEGVVAVDGLVVLRQA